MRKKPEKIFQRYVAETNASRNAIHFDYLLTKEDDNFYVNELGEMDGNLNGKRILIADNLVVEAVLGDNKLK